MCGPSSETDASACLGSCVPESVQLFNRFSTETITLPVQTSHDTGTTASPHCILLARQLIMPECSYVPPQIEQQTCDRNCPTSLRNTHHEPCTEPVEKRHLQLFSHLPVRSTGSWHRPRHLNLRGAFWAVASCSVQRSCQRDVALCIGGEHSVCNSELKQSSLVLTLCHINLRTTCARFPRHRHE